MELNRSAQEYFVDGCNAANKVCFRVAKAGRHHLQCRVYVAKGKKFFLFKVYTHIRVLLFSQNSPDALITDLRAKEHMVAIDIRLVVSITENTLKENFFFGSRSRNNCSYLWSRKRRR